MSQQTTATVYNISIHAPPRGATKFSRENIATLLFQFTPLREGRHQRQDGGALE